MLQTGWKQTLYNSSFKMLKYWPFTCFRMDNCTQNRLLALKWGSQGVGNSLGKSVQICLPTQIKWLTYCDSTSCTKGFISFSNGYLVTSYLSKNWCVRGEKKKKKRKQQTANSKPWINPAYLGLVPDSQVWRIVCWVPAYGYMEENVRE